MGEPYEKAIEDVRSTAKWLLASLTAGGLVTTAGFQVSRLGKLDPSRDGVRLALAAALLVSSAGVIVWLILRTAAVLTGRWLTLTDLSDEELDKMLTSRATSTNDVLQVLRAIENVKEEVYGAAASSVAQLHRQLREHNRAAAELIADQGKARDREHLELAHQAFTLSAELSAAAAQVVSYANWWQADRQLRNLRTPLVVGIGAVLALSCAFGVVTTPPEKASKPLRVEIVDR